jgi:adenine-specific DNA-methyltransferase
VSRPAQSTSLVNSLLDRVRKTDPALADDLRAAFRIVTADREFGLVFNRHLPETVELPGRKVRARDKVRIAGATDDRAWRVGRIRRVNGERVAELVSIDTAAETETLPVAYLVVVADFRDPIYPGLKSKGTIERGGDKPTQVVINAENYHALEALTFAYASKVDCIYIDPPYNTGGDLIYNDKRVSTEDGDRHAKWLSFIERRLRLAKRLLKPTGILIVAVDDNEQAHLRASAKSHFMRSAVV